MPASGTSLGRRLMLWLLPPLLLLSVVWAWGVYAVILHFTNIAYDRALEDSAQTLAGQVSVRHDGVHVDLPQAARAMLEFDQVDTIHYSVSDRLGARLAGNARIPEATRRDTCVDHTCFYDAAMDGKPVRVAEYTLSIYSPASPLTVRVAETVRKREMLAREVLRFVLLPQALFVACIGILIWYGVKRGMAPLRRIRDAIAQRTHDDLRHIEIADMPAELQEHTAVINDLMSRLGREIDAKKRFIADATHQLRTPITVLRTQAELALRLREHGELRAAVKGFDAATARLVRLANQLLSLSLAEARALGPRDFERFDVAALAEDAIAELVPLALEKELDIAVEGCAAPLVIVGHPQFVREMMANLIDNAIRYTPAGGAIRIAMAGAGEGADGRIAFSVADTGPGIPRAERDKVLQPFYRGLGMPGGGSGLGLTIASEIAAMHGGEVRIEDGAGQGTTVVASLPAVPPEPRT